MLLKNWRSNLQGIRAQMSRRWEELFFLVAFFLLFLQVVFFKSAISGLADLHGAIAWFAAFDIFIASRLVYFAIPLFCRYSFSSCSQARIILGEDAFSTCLGGILASGSLYKLLDLISWYLIP